MNVRELLQSKKQTVVTIDVEDTIGAAARIVWHPGLGLGPGGCHRAGCALAADSLTSA